MRRALMSMLVLTLMSMLALGAGGCGTAGPSDSGDASLPASSEVRITDPQVAAGDVEALVVGNTAFALDLFNVARQADDQLGQNLVFSPYSLSLALAMTYAGAGGETERQMADVLHFTLPQGSLHLAFDALDLDIADTEVEKLTVAGSAWVFPPVFDRILPGYLDLLAQDYGAELHQAPANTEEARQIINAWAADKTQGLITDILPPGSLPQEYTALVLANALYLKASWTYAFPPSNTQPAPFHLEDGTTVDVPMMGHTMDFGYAEDDTWGAVELPLQGAKEREWGDLSMVFLLPKEGSLDQAVAATTAESLQTLLTDMPRDLIAVHVPKFEFGTGIELKDALISLGMIDAFAGEKADLSRAYKPAEGAEAGGPTGIWVDEVYHGGTIAIDESGIEAAAASMVVQVGGIGPGSITLDRPFLFVIRHLPTGSILFLGQVTDPLEGRQG